jgi:DNA-binding IclR family transcriptional regulator
MTDVPALARGLSLLETIAAATQPPSFVDLWRWSALPKASVARLLACLRERGYLSGGDGASSGYQLGPRCALLSAGPERLERMGILLQPTVARIAISLGHSAIAHGFSANTFTVVAQQSVEDGISLSPVGSKRTDNSGGPWGALAWLALSEVEQSRSRSSIANPEQFDAELPRLRAALTAKGALLDDGVHRKGVRRLAVPLHVHDGRCVGSIGIGAIATALDERELSEAIAALKREARALTETLSPLFLEIHA